MLRGIALRLGQPVFLAALLVLSIHPALPVSAATIVVNNINDDSTTNASGDGDCTLRKAIDNANSPEVDTTLGDCAIGSGNDTITFNLSGTVMLNGGPPMTGPPVALPAIARTLTIDGTGQAVAVYGGGIYGATFGVFVVDASATLNLKNLTVENGSAANGGGVSNSGTLTVTNSTLSANAATAGNGGGVYNTSTGKLTVTGSTFSANTASGNGGAIDSETGTSLNVVNSTFSANTAGADGGGINSNTGSTTATITDSTFWANSAAAGPSIDNAAGTFTINNSILATGAAVANCAGTITDGDGYNIADDPAGDSCSFGSPTGANGQTIGANVSDANIALVLPLANNGGPTETFAVGEASYALAAVPLAQCTLATDQRGLARPGPGFNACDIGAYEFQTTLTVANVSAGPGGTFGVMATLGPTDCAAGETVLFTFQSNVVAATTNGSGVATALFFAPTVGGTYPIQASFGGSGAVCHAASGVGLMTDNGPMPTPGPTPAPTSSMPTPTPGPTPPPGLTPTSVTVADVTAQGGTVFVAAAGLGSGACTVGQGVTFTFESSEQIAFTGTNGVANVTFTAPLTPGVYTIEASVTANSGCAASTGTGSLTVPVPTPTTLNVANVGGNAGGSFVASAALGPNSCALGQTVIFTFDGSSKSAVTTFNGTATARFPVPNSPGLIPIQASFAGNANCGPAIGNGVLTISGQVAPVTLLPTFVSFATQALGSQSGGEEILLANRQSVPMKVMSITITGGKGTFTETDNCVGTLAPKSTCTINTSFAPSATTKGAQTATLQVHDTLNATASGAASHPQRVSLSGTGVAAATAASSGLSFGSQAVGTISKSKSVTITNNLGVQLAFTNVNTSGDFVITGSKCSGEVAKKSSCTVSVAFRPSVKGARTGTLTIDDDASTLPVTVSLSGTGK